MDVEALASGVASSRLRELAVVDCALGGAALLTWMVQAASARESRDGQLQCPPSVEVHHDTAAPSMQRTSLDISVGAVVFLR